MDGTIRLYNIITDGYVVKLSVEKIVPISDIKEIIKPDTLDKYNEFGSYGCCKVYLHSDDKEHYIMQVDIK